MITLTEAQEAKLESLASCAIKLFREFPHLLDDDATMIEVIMHVIHILET